MITVNKIQSSSTYVSQTGFCLPYFALIITTKQAVDF